MGAWAHGSFANDDAMDFEDELKDAESLEPITLAFTRVLRNRNDYLEAPKASRGIAAAEVVAALLGKPAAKLPDDVVAWVKGRKPPERAMVKEAQQVVARILNESELKDLWSDSADSALWEKEVENLLLRLGATLV